MLGVLVARPDPAPAQIDVLPPPLAGKLVAANQRALALAPDGDALRFQSGGEAWEEAAPPALIDVDQDGRRDYIVMLLEDGVSGRRALLCREWGEAADAFGPAVFYVIVEADDEVAEWAGRPRLEPPGRPAR
jgi:hypothetical protein